MKYFMLASLLIACGDKENDSADPEEAVEESEKLKTAGRHGFTDALFFLNALKAVVGWNRRLND